MTKSFRVSADIGGTFTDLVFQDSKTGECRALKVLSTPSDPANAVLQGIEAAISPDDNIEFFVHGTTVGLNALLTRSGAKVALLTTENFRDIYAIQGNDRGEIFSIRWNKPELLVSLEHTYTAKERIAADGSVVTPLSQDDLVAFGDAVEREGYEAIAISFLFSFKNGDHERAAAAYLSKRFPDISIAMSHKVSPEWREFERTSTTVMDAYLAPVVRKYIKTLVGKLSDRLPENDGIHVMESNGGVMTASSASDAPLQTLLSGPVGGTIGGGVLAQKTNRPNLICVDMGGTSFDASLIVDGRPSTSNSAVLEGLPIQMSTIDIHVIGAGGGSIAWNEVNAIRVGPQAAGSYPGPVCYGNGGTEPTVSDANLVLGRLDSSNFSAGKMQLDKDAAAEALANLGKPFDMDAVQMAQGVIDIVNAKMADAIRTITVQRGIDPRDFALVAFGGAGPAQAVAIAQELNIDEVIIPGNPGAFSAMGMLQTDMRHDYKESMFSFWDTMPTDQLEAAFKRLEAQGNDFLLGEHITPDNIRFERSVDLRYLGQEYVLTIPIPEGALDMDAARHAFDEAYLRQYGHSSPENRVEMANIRVAAIGQLERPLAASASVTAPQAPRERAVVFAGKSVNTAIISRAAVTAEAPINGPAIIEEGTTTTLVPPDWSATLISGNHMLLQKVGQ